MAPTLYNRFRRFIGPVWMRFAALNLLLMMAFSARAETFGDWRLACQEEKCQAVQQLFVTQGEKRSPVLSVTLSQLNSQKLLQLILPTGLDLRPGVVIRVDESQEVHFPFTTCVKDACIVLVPLKTALLKRLKAGNTMKVGFRPFNSEQTLVVEASLKGFTKASARVR